MTSGQADSKTRFTSRVADYVRYRPGYPDGLIEVLRSEAGLTSASIVADIGAGTGISTEIFLRVGCTVFAVEPNAAMRAAGDLGREIGDDQSRSVYRCVRFERNTGYSDERV